MTVKRALADYVAASRAYQRDCNTRLNAKRGDKRRAKLLRADETAFGRFVRAIKSIHAGLAACVVLCGCAGHYGPPALFKGQPAPRSPSPEVLATRAPVPAFDPSILRPGDVLLYAPDDLIGDIIAVKTGRLKSHVEGYVGGGRVVAARIKGVNVYPLRVDACLASVRRHPDWKRFDGDAAMRAVSPILGQSYDIPGLFTFFCPWKVPKEVVRVCSPVVCIWERGGGCEPFNADLDSNGVTPAAFFETGGLVTIWRNPVIDRSFIP